MAISAFYKIENIVGKGENAVYMHFYTPANKGWGGILESACQAGARWLGGRSVRKILSGQLLLKFQSNLLDTWQKCSLGAVDVQDTNFVKIAPDLT